MDVMMNANLVIEGMSCEHCVRQVTRTLEAVPQVVVRNVRVGNAEIGVPDERTATLAAEAVATAGYPAHVVARD